MPRVVGAISGSCGESSLAEPIVVPEGIGAMIRAHAAAAYPEECCGALLGYQGARGVSEVVPGARTEPQAESQRESQAASQVEARREVVRVIPVANEWEGERGSRYLIRGDVVLALDAEARRSGLALIGFYHSHPDGAAVPSTFDREAAWPWYSYLIISTGSAEGAQPSGQLRGWQLRDDRSGFVEQPILIPGYGRGG